MTTADGVRAAANPQEALLAIAESLDRLHEKVDSPPQPAGWEDWTAPAPDAPVAKLEVDEDGDTTVVVPPASAEKQASRRAFALDVLKLTEAYGSEAGIEYADSYAEAGPRLLYSTDRDFVMSLPAGIKRTMIADLEEEDPQEAAEMARDILKDSTPGALPDFTPTT